MQREGRSEKKNGINSFRILWRTNLIRRGL
jgi:hypothetical protein